MLIIRFCSPRPTVITKCDRNVGPPASLSLRDAICPLISADGSAVYLSVPQPNPKGGPHWNQIVELPLAGGEPRILFALRYTGNPGNSMYMWTTVCRDQR
jgi:hypothetical protein